MIRLGLTGSIGMGKSTTAALFRDLGVPVHDADAEIHALYSAEAVAPVEAAFPGVAADGTIDRALLSERVLNDKAAMGRLQGIVYPLLIARRDAFLAKAEADGEPLVVLDIPLLFETGGEAMVDAVAVVSAPAEIQRDRVLSRPGMDVGRFAAILAQQMPDAEKRARADYVIDTGRGIEAAREQVKALVATLRPA